MFVAMQSLLRNKYIQIQLVALAGWLLIEACGYGFGLFKYLSWRPLTNAEGFHVTDLVHGSAPKGPVRLTVDERAALTARVSAAFGGTVPTHDELGELRRLYQPKDGVQCEWRRGTNIASDPSECNALKDAKPIFTALLQFMHPKTEWLLLEEVKGHKGDMLAVAFFVGLAGKPQILIDFSRVRSDTWDTSKGFVAKAWHGGGNGLTELALGKEVQGAGSRFYLIDDPGVFERRRPGCTHSSCWANFLFYGYSKEGWRDTLGNFTTSNLADVAIKEGLEQRFKLFAAMMNQPYVAPAAAKYEVRYQPEKSGVTKWDVQGLAKNIDALMGAGTTARAVFSPMAYSVSMGKVYGFRLDGKFYTIWEAISPESKDRFVFRKNVNGTATNIDGVPGIKGLYIVPLPVAPMAKGTSLTVHLTGRLEGRPWSEFTDFETVFKPLGFDATKGAAQ